MPESLWYMWKNEVNGGYEQRGDEQVESMELSASSRGGDALGATERNVTEQRDVSGVFFASSWIRPATGSSGEDNPLLAFLQHTMAMVRHHHGEVLELPEGIVLARFADARDALLAGLALQQIWTSSHDVMGKIGIAQGAGVLLQWPDGLRHCGGEGPDLALRLCREAYAGVVLVADSALPDRAVGATDQGGWSNEWPLQRVAGVHWGDGGSLPCHAALPKTGIAAMVQGTSPEPLGGEDELPGRRHFGQVVLVKEERGYGFIRFLDDQGVEQDLFFHISHVIDRLPVKVGQRVNFALRPGKGGRLQAQSVLILGHALQGQVDEVTPTTVVLSLRDERSDSIRFVANASELVTNVVRPGMVVEFMAGEREERLQAMGVKLFQGVEPPPHVGTGDNLELGTWEEGVIHEYFVDKGYGFIRCRRNDVYFHIAELFQPDRMPARGERVEFRVAPGRNAGYRAVEVRFLAATGEG